MKKVMIVDDEILIRENIRSCVDWTKEGFIYCGDAPDGEIALPLIEEHKPDILITDIKMPFMDGLELTAIVRKQMPDMKVIIMSGHDEFRYAQNAIRLGVEDYCLKPISASELIAILQKVSKKIDEEQKRQKSQSITKERLLSDLCGGLIGTSEAIESAKELSIPLTSRFYAAAILDIRLAESSDLTLLNGIRNEIDRQLEQPIECLSYYRSRSELVCIFKSHSAEEMAQLLQSFNPRIRTELERQFGCEIYTGIGSIQERIQGIHFSYLEAEEDKYISRLTQLNQASLHDIHEPMDVVLDRSIFFEFVKIGVPSQRDSFVREFAGSLKSLPFMSSYSFYLLNDLTLEALRAAKQSFRTGADPGCSIARLQQEIKKISTWEDCCHYLSSLLNELWQWRAESSDKYGDVIKQVKEYIVSHYNNEQLSLKIIANHVRISPSHLSKVFSQETGQTLTEYLTQIRIGKAMELLKTTRSKSFEIAFEVGYNDPHYFSNLFKKMTGMTPKEYRNQGTKDETA
ncbi:two-component system, response regulator YesN [Paenibacillus catalpae]|uniref:Two-component system, response regulator YesN n=1 Tax=Paenibacillus catalpae TaxID=1045775 RepID=A0A1I1UAP2_9BACL|nr:response regulator [Paenibacillus catalpae]SFD65833.1 two-component system, response regulator YesN [Paenibacillus catalpae]